VIGPPGSRDVGGESIRFGGIDVPVCQSVPSASMNATTPYGGSNPSTLTQQQVVLRQPRVFARLAGAAGVGDDLQ